MLTLLLFFGRVKNFELLNVAGLVRCKRRRRLLLNAAAPVHLDEPSAAPVPLLRVKAV
jgi:hypothetical protein